jgi:2-amino-4-hydroxy-6-hydroxymethyldihydropteridine diphosphokinase
MTAGVITPHQAFLSLGSNLGEKAENLKRAREELSLKGVQLQKATWLYHTEPVDYEDQDWFLNQILQVGTPVEPRELLNFCLEVESDLGRERWIPQGPRLIDIDILLYDRIILNLPDLQIPHPRMHLRRFILEPLVTLAPDVLHPVLRKTISVLLRECRDPAKVIKLDA